MRSTLTVLSRQVWAVDLARSYDANNNLTSRTTAAGTTTFTYDRLNRLASETGPARTQNFGYDPNGNRTSDGSGSYTPAPSSNRYATIRASTASYDAAGNLLALATGSPLATRTFTYNQAGRLAEVRQGGVLLASYTYNANGQRSRKTLTAQGAAALGLPATALTIVFHYDLSGNLLAETSGSGTPIRTYVWREAASGPLAETMLDHPVAQIEHANNAALGGSNGTATEAVLYLRTDELATPREARNAQGTVVWSWTSAAFGDTNPAQDPDGNGQRTIVNLRFPGQYADQEAGLHYNWHRSYDPATGRYLESDPIGSIIYSDLPLKIFGPIAVLLPFNALRSLASDGTRYNNAYSYASSHPTGRLDQLGLLDPPNGRGDGQGGGARIGDRCRLVQQLGPFTSSPSIPGATGWLYLCVYDCGNSCPPRASDIIVRWQWVFNRVGCVSETTRRLNE